MSDFVHLKLPSPWATEADLRDEVERLRAEIQDLHDEVERLRGESERCSEIRRQNDTRLTRERDAWKGAHAGAVRALKALRAELRRVEQQRDAAESQAIRPCVTCAGSGWTQGGLTQCLVCRGTGRKR